MALGVSGAGLSREPVICPRIRMNLSSVMPLTERARAGPRPAEYRIKSPGQLGQVVAGHFGVEMVLEVVRQLQEQRRDNLPSQGVRLRQRRIAVLAGVAGGPSAADRPSCRRSPVRRTPARRVSGAAARARRSERRRPRPPRRPAIASWRRPACSDIGPEPEPGQKQRSPHDSPSRRLIRAGSPSGSSGPGKIWWCRRWVAR